MAWPPEAEAVLLCACGPVIGSFIGAVADRLPHGESFVWGRSRCRSCGTTLGLVDLMPIVSFLMLRGRCRHCRRDIPRELQTIETTALAVTIVAVAALPVEHRLVGVILAWVLLGLSWCDVRHWRLPDAVTMPLAVSGIGLAALTRPAHLMDHVVGTVVGYVAFAGLAWIYRRSRGRDGLGGGDAKLLAAAGAWVGWQLLPWIVLVSSGAALVYATAHRRVALQDAIPLGPFLALALWIVWVWTNRGGGA